VRRVRLRYRSTTHHVRGRSRSSTAAGRHRCSGSGHDRGDRETRASHSRRGAGQSHGDRSRHRARHWSSPAIKTVRVSTPRGGRVLAGPQPQPLPLKSTCASGRVTVVPSCFYFFRLLERGDVRKASAPIDSTFKRGRLQTPKGQQRKNGSTTGERQVKLSNKGTRLRLTAHGSQIFLNFTQLHHASTSRPRRRAPHVAERPAAQAHPYRPWCVSFHRASRPATRVPALHPRHTPHARLASGHLRPPREGPPRRRSATPCPLRFSCLPLV
jgi:hypothetical protein